MELDNANRIAWRERENLERSEFSGMYCKAGGEQKETTHVQTFCKALCYLYDPCYLFVCFVTLSQYFISRWSSGLGKVRLKVRWVLRKKGQCGCYSICFIAEFVLRSFCVVACLLKMGESMRCGRGCHDNSLALMQRRCIGVAMTTRLIRHRRPGTTLSHAETKEQRIMGCVIQKVQVNFCVMALFSRSQLDNMDLKSIMSLPNISILGTY